MTANTSRNTSRRWLTRLCQVGYLATAVTDTVLAGQEDGPKAARARAARRITKPLLMPLLSASLASDPRAQKAPLRNRTLAGQMFSWGGDVALLQPGSNAFMTGAGSFGAAHAFYISGFIKNRRPGMRFWVRPLTLSATALGASAGPPLVVAAGQQDPTLRGPVTAYTVMLSTMMATAGNLDPALPKRARVLTGAGSVCFAASDLALGIRQFMVTEATQPATRAFLGRFVMGTYTLAQWLLSQGAAASAPDESATPPAEAQSAQRLAA